MFKPNSWIQPHKIKINHSSFSYILRIIVSIQPNNVNKIVKPFNNDDDDDDDEETLHHQTKHPTKGERKNKKRKLKSTTKTKPKQVHEEGDEQIML